MRSHARIQEPAFKMSDEELVARAIAQWNNRVAVSSREEQQQPGDKEQDESDDDDDEEEEDDDDDDDGDRKPKAASTTAKGTAKRPRKKYRPRVRDPIHHYPVPPRLINAVHKPKSHVNHSYRDFSNVPPEKGYKAPPTINDMTFAQKVHHMLSHPQFEAMIAWMPHGRAFRVLLPNDFEQQVMPVYFGHSRYSNFLSMVRQYGFKCFTQGPDKGCLYHEYMLRGLPHLAKYMPLPRTPRRLIEDPANEPDLYAITKLHPVPLTGPEEDKPEAPPIAVASIPPQRPTPDELLAAALTGANASSLSSALALLRSSQHRPLASSIPNVAAAAAASSSYPTQQQHAAALAASARMDPNSLTAYLSINNPLATAMSTATYPASSTVNNMFSSNAINTTDATANHLAARQRLWLASQATNNIAADGAAAAASSPAFLSGVALQQHLNLDANTFFSNRQQHQQYHHHRLGLESSIMNAALYAAASAAAAATSESKVNSNGPPGGSSSDES